LSASAKVGRVSSPLDPGFLALAVVVLVVAGGLNGLAGFGFALVGTMALATVVEPATAVVFMIVPVMAVNLALVRELPTDQLRTCGRRFWPLVLAALVGTVVGMAALDRLPVAPLRLGLGVLTLAFVATLQGRIALPGVEGIRDRCFVETPAAMVGLGAVSGLVFGGTNVGVQLVAYVRSFDLPHGLFVGVLAMVFLWLNAVRVGAAGVLGLYPTTTWVVASGLAVLPAVAGVAIGSRLRDRLADRYRRGLVLGLLGVVGVRLVLAGAGVA